MLGLDRRAARYTWTAALILILLLTIYLIRNTLFVFIVALLFAYLLSPLVDFLDRVLPASRTRTPALVVAYLILVGLLVFGGFELGTRVVEQANALVKKLPDLLGKAIGAGPMPAGPRSLSESVLGNLQSQIRQHANDIVAYLPKAGLTALSIVGNMVFIIVVPILSFFFLKDGRIMRQEILDLFEDSPRRDLLEGGAVDVQGGMARDPIRRAPDEVPEGPLDEMDHVGVCDDDAPGTARRSRREQDLRRVGPGVAVRGPRAGIALDLGQREMGA